MRRAWTEEEVAFLEKWYEKRGIPFFMKKFNRTEASVKRKAQKLGLNAYICEELYVKMVARCFHCDSSVINRWIDKYGLPFRKVQRGQATCKLINTDNFWKWAEDHKDIIPWQKYDRLSLLPEPEWLDACIKASVKNNRKKVSTLERNAVIRLRNKGESFEQIADELGRTVDSVKHIWRKYGNVKKRTKRKKVEVDQCD